MAFKSTYNEHKSRERTYQNNQRPENACCANCAYYGYHGDIDGWGCTRSYNVVYRMSREVARTKVCSQFVPGKNSW